MFDDLRHLLVEMERGAERFDLFEQTVDEFLRIADRDRGNVVDRLVGIEFGALSAGLRQRIDDVCLQPEQAEFENLEQAARPGADDDDIGLSGHGVSVS